MFDKLRRELKLCREMRALIKQAEVEAHLACSHMVEAEHLPAAMAAVPFGLDPGRDGCAPTDSSNTHRYQLTNHGLRRSPERPWSTCWPSSVTPPRAAGRRCGPVKKQRGRAASPHPVQCPRRITQATADDQQPVPGCRWLGGPAGGLFLAVPRDHHGIVAVGTNAG